MRSSHVLLACALILAPIAGVPLSATAPNTPAPSGSGTSSPGTIKHPINNSVSHLAIKSKHINSTAIETVTLDVGGTAAIDGSTFRREYRSKRFDAAKENASDEQAVVDRALNRAENRTIELRERQREAVINYHDGTLSAQAFLRELAVITAEANQLRVFVKHVGRNSQRANNLKSELSSLLGPVRTRIQSTLKGDSDAPKRYFIQTSTQGVILSTISDGQYIRQVYLAGARSESNSTGSVSTDKIVANIKKSYPSTNNSGIVTQETYSQHIKYTFQPPSVRITTYTDRSSGEIFYEHQVVSISDKRTVRGPRNTSGPVALVTNTTYTGGYMVVRLTDPEKDEVLNGTIRTITADNETKTIGTTACTNPHCVEGELMMLQPPNGTTITATVDGETVSVTMGESQKPPGPAPAIHGKRQNMWQQLRNMAF